MCKIKREGTAGDAVGGEPVVGEPEVRAENDPVLREFRIQVMDAVFDDGVFDGYPEVAHADLEQLLVGPFGPHRSALRRGDRGPRLATAFPSLSGRSRVSVVGSPS